MIKKGLVIFCVLFCSVHQLKAINFPKLKFSAEIVLNKYATHVVSLSNDNLILITSKTQEYTVDTPEDKGLVNINTSVSNLFGQIAASDQSIQKYKVFRSDGSEKTGGDIVSGDQLLVTAQDGKSSKKYQLLLKPMAVGGKLSLSENQFTLNSKRDLVLFFTAGQRTPDATVKIFIPNGIIVTLENTWVNVIGRGEVKLKDLHLQSIGRVGTNYSYSKVGSVEISKLTDGGSVIWFKHLDFRPSNGSDLKILIKDVNLSKIGSYQFKANYTTSKPEVLSSAGIGAESATLLVKSTIANFERVIDKRLSYKETKDTYIKVNFKWNGKGSVVQLMQSVDNGKTWSIAAVSIKANQYLASLKGLIPNKLYTFRLLVKSGENKGFSNQIKYYSGKMDVKSFGITGDGKQDETDKINKAINYINTIGGGTLLFSKGTYQVKTVHLKSNVYLFVDKEAIIKALKGGDAPETTWFCDKKYRSGLSPTDQGPYVDPENYMTKQDVGHHYFRNTMFFGERLDNVKIIGNGYITGNGNLVTGDKVMNNAPDNRSDKMFTLKLCTNLEIGGLYSDEDLWYDEQKDQPYYILKNGSKMFDLDNMLKIDRAGHFALLATGTDGINVHDTYFAKNNTSNVRDIYDFMACNNVTVTNIYSKVSSDDIVKPGSDCSLGFTRPASNYKVRNIIGDTNCNLFQIGSETADDIMDVHVDNMYVLGANKAGFSISTNDGAHVKDIHLNCGHTGKIHSRSKMFRTTTPFFISISNRARILGANVTRVKFDENGVKHDELLVNNVNIGIVENIIINGVDVFEVYGGSSFGDATNRWKEYDGKQRKASPIIAGYSLPDSSVIEGKLNFKLPNGLHTGYIKNMVFNDVQFLVKGGNIAADTIQSPPELGVGQYNVSNLKIQPSYGIWARHVKGLTITKSSFNFENPDGRYALFLDDVKGSKIMDVKIMKPKNHDTLIYLKNSSNVFVDKVTFYPQKWGNDAITINNSDKNQTFKGIIKSYSVNLNNKSNKP